MSESNHFIENEVRFLEVDVDAIKHQLKKLGATNLGEDLLEERIYYNESLSWRDEGKLVRIRKTSNTISMSFKQYGQGTIGDTKEIEIMVSDVEHTHSFLESIGLICKRIQEKKRHSYHLEGVDIEIDYWPNIPAYLELESSSTRQLQDIAEKLHLNWEEANTHNAAWVIEHVYGIPVKDIERFVF